MNNLYGSKAETVFEFNADLFDGAKLEFIVDVSLAGRHSSGSMKVTLMRNN
ncbi:hypothetical protein [Anaerocolumna sedimenticola]|uniref:hypothetical protein n=1 Tax=Anaerocolumna sedimenticola TaxID=2696063 RepID=UPI001FE82118|nr:hypothetical protein [Anaerocolumna sedimenticola]